MCTSSTTIINISTTAPTPTVLMYLGDTAVYTAVDLNLVLEYGTKFSTLDV
jgi:hypothetical protein